MSVGGNVNNCKVGRALLNYRKFCTKADAFLRFAEERNTL